MRDLLAHFGSLQRAWQAPENELRSAGLPAKSLEKLCAGRETLDLKQEMQKVRDSGTHLITLLDEAYPSLLKTIDDPPPLLYVRGELKPEDNLALAVVGTRKATRYGRDATFMLAKHCAAQGVTIVSGLAQGIDTAAHRGAIASGGRTIAVLGTGTDRIYPNENTELAAHIVKNGAIISEFPIGTPPLANNFPRRNRIISGLACGVLVGEAPENSGALITVQSALEQGRDVFAVPANIFNETGAGANRLIQDGARLVMNAADILSELNIAYIQAETERRTDEIAPTNDTETLILSMLESDPVHIDDIIHRTGLAAPEVLSTLSVLELKGLAQTEAPMQYCRARP